MNANTQYDISQKEREVLEWRANRRKELREKYLKEVHNPNRTEQMADDALMKFQMARQVPLVQARRGVGRWFHLSFITGIAVISYIICQARDEFEQKIRTGQIPYSDRFKKFP